MNLKNLQPDIKRNEHWILTPKELVRNLSRKEASLYAKRFSSAEKNAKEFKQRWQKSLTAYILHDKLERLIYEI